MPLQTTDFKVNAINQFPISLDILFFFTNITSYYFITNNIGHVLNGEKRGLLLK